MHHRHGCQRSLGAVVALVLSLMGAGTAEPLGGGRLPAPASWLVAGEAGVTALLQGGQVVRITAAGATLLAEGWRGDVLVPCGEDLLGVDERGRLALLHGGARGPTAGPHSVPACLPDGRVAALAEDAAALYLLGSDLELLVRQPVEALPDAALVPAELGGALRLALLTGPTRRYPHGVIGDELESLAVSVHALDDLMQVASYTLPEPFVFEQLRLLPYAAGDVTGLLATRSSPRSGAGVVLLTLAAGELLLRAEADPIGLGNRWLNLFAAREGWAYAVRTPHIGGPFERYRLEGNRLEVDQFQLGVTNHVLGSRNLDLGVLLPERRPGLAELVLPTRDLRALRLIRCDAAGCLAAADFPLAGRLSSNLAFGREAGALVVYAGDDAGLLHRFALPEP